MSVYGEFHRYLEALIGQLEALADADDRALIAALRGARPGGSTDLTESARTVLGLLSDPRIETRLRGSALADARAENLQEPRENLSAICRIVVGA